MDQNIESKYGETVNTKTDAKRVEEMATKNNKIYFADKCNNVCCLELKEMSFALRLGVTTESL